MVEELFTKLVPVINNSPVRIEIVWHAADETLTPPEGVAAGRIFHLETYVGERFDVYELPDEETRKCRESSVAEEESNDDDDSDDHDDEACWQTSFVISAGPEVEVTIGEEFKATVVDATVLAQQYATEALEDCDGLTNSEEELLACLQEQATASLQHWTDEWDFHHAALQRMGAQLEEYVCHDPPNCNHETSPALAEQEWQSGAGDTTREHQVQILHSRPSSQIHVLDNFITPEECRAIENTAAPRLQRAKVLDGQGGSKLSNERRAWQASIEIPWHLEDDQNPLTTVSRRVYDYTNHVLGLNISHHGQERLMSIQYFGRDDDDDDKDQPLDQYESHCDGPCKGAPHQVPDRIATMVLYCETPTVGGGHTHFRTAGVHVQPRPGSAVFFSYIHPTTLETDVGWTEHTGCPVYEGTKKIVTQWVRLGVSDERPWKHPAVDRPREL